MTPTSRPTLCRNESMQKYMLLSAQKEALQRRMALEIPFAAPMAAESPEFQSLSSSPTWSPKYTSPYPAATDPVPSRCSMSPRGSVDDMHTSEAAKLAELNHQIIATLTELLNTESVRSDEKHHRWIQDRLMELEHQIRRDRRRHSSNAERNFASSVARHNDFGTSKTWA
ncbi:hypothetical protein NX059_004824 [Plenodomus lindquistii]|nr:hypothetical protein NX059_004824 [Plenodomus lindquistii]